MIALTDRVVGPPPAPVAVAGAAAVGGPFSLVDQDGRPVTEQTFRGRWMLIYFGYTHCPDACPTALSEMAEALAQLAPAAREKVQPVFITVDPERDTPAVLKDYVAAFDAGVVGLTGNAEQVAGAAKAFRVYHAKHRRDGVAAAGGTDEGYSVDHSSIIYVMDPQGRFAAHFTHETPPERIAGKLAEIVS
jgi:protein SCO1/2